MKKLKKQDIFDIVLLAVSFLLVFLSFLLAKEKNIWSLISSAFGISCIVFNARGSVVGQFLSVVFAVTYAVLAYMHRYYGELLIYIFLMLPIHIVSIYTWFKNRGADKTVKINTLPWWEYLLLVLGDVFVSFGFYFLLRALNTNELVISTVSLVTSLSASYLMLRRSEFFSICFIFNDVILIVLWGLQAMTDPGCLPSVLSFTVFLFVDTYCFICWAKRKKLQKLIEEGI